MGQGNIHNSRSLPDRIDIWHAGAIWVPGGRKIVRKYSSGRIQDGGRHLLTYRNRN